MARWLLALLALAGFAAATVAAPARDWTRTVTRTPAGAVVIGNPAAPAKLVEYLSYTCPHCAHFTGESAATLRDQWVRDGSTSVEVRHAIRDALDLAAALLARCAGPRFPAVHDAVFAAQDQWFQRGADYIQANGERLQAKPELARLRALADGAGLTDIARASGRLTPRALDACFATDVDLKRVTAMAEDAGRMIQGTPSFALNGAFIGSQTWASLEPRLRAAGAH